MCHPVYGTHFHTNLSSPFLRPAYQYIIKRYNEPYPLSSIPTQCVFLPQLQPLGKMALSQQSLTSPCPWNMWPPAHPWWNQFPHTKRTSLENSNHYPCLQQVQLLVSKQDQFFIPFLCIGISTGERMVRQTSATTATPDTKSLQKSVDGKVSNHEVSSASPLGGLQSDSESIAFSDMLKKIRIIHEKCPKCLLLQWQKIGTPGTSLFNEIKDWNSRV